MLIANTTAVDPYSLRNLERTESMDVRTQHARDVAEAWRQDDMVPILPELVAGMTASTQQEKDVKHILTQNDAVGALTLLMPLYNELDALRLVQAAAYDRASGFPTDII